MVIETGQRNSGALAIKSAGQVRPMQEARHGSDGRDRQNSMTSRQVSQMTNGFLKGSSHVRESSQSSQKENLNR
jgi:hypothetical protein